MIQPHFDFGIKQLLPEWRNLFSRRYFFNDVAAGIAVACIAIPLSLAIALASGVDPELGLVSAIIAGIVCALFGGVPLAVSGPAAAMAVIVATAAEKYGLPGLLVIGLGCGILQLITGFIGFGTFIRFIPVPVIMGFTAGIGAIILIGQFPRVLGLPAAEENHIFSVILHLNNLIAETNLNALLLALSTYLITIFLPRIWPRLPSPLLAVAIPTLVAYILHLPVELIGTIPSSLPWPKLPTVPLTFEWTSLISTIFVVYAIASLETLLSAGAVDQLAKSKPHDPNQELIGQGFGNIVTALFGGITVTAVIARSALNVHAGAKTRRASIFHSLFLLATIYLLAPAISQIPIAVLAGLLMTIAIRMCSPHEFLQLWHSSRADAAIYLITFFMIVLLGLLSGIQAGFIAALLLSALRLSQVNIHFHTSQYGPATLSLKGPLTFLSAPRIKDYEKKLTAMDLPSGLIIDLSRLKVLDTSGARYLIDLVEQLQRKNVKSVLYVLDSEHIKILTSVKEDIDRLIANSEAEMESILDITSQHQQLVLDRVIYGIEKFKSNLRPKHIALFSSLAKVQTPHTLFITCSDSRIDPNLITSTQPGELFIVRNVGNIVPPFGEDSKPAEGAAIEYALGILNVDQIIICAHSECGAIREVISGNIFSPDNQKKFPSIAAWLSMLKELKSRFTHNVTPENAAKLNASLQLANLKTYPIVREKIANKSIKLQALYYDIGKADVERWDEVLGKYVGIGENTEPVVFGANQIKGLKWFTDSSSN